MATGFKAVLSPVRRAFEGMTGSDAAEGAVLCGQDSIAGLGAGVEAGVGLRSKIDVEEAVKADVATADVTDADVTDVAKVDDKMDVEPGAEAEAVEFDEKLAVE